MMHTLRKHSSILAKMKIFLPLVVWIILLFRTTNAQLSASRKHVGIFGLKHEVFFLNLEDGYFGCQVNESTDYLQLYELSKLCDGTSDCYMGSDELRNKLKCTNDCDKDGTACSNGVCLDGLCHCNDGFGGCNCQVPDENECKYRPCDVFAHCTNTLGSFTCTCFPGYQGDGLHCEDIDECQDPNIAQRCVENAECCNLPAHFVCKCKPGFEGDGEERCADINECLDPQACGLNAECVNLPGNYTCQCREGFYGDPYNGCIDVDECVQPGVCGPGAICTNLEGGYRCDCPQGFDGDARSAQGCLDYDECARSPCGRNALCRNEVGSFRCECQQGFSGDPMTDCQAACSETDECNQDEVCSNGQCINPCHEVNACGMNAECLMGAHTKQCSCPAGFTGEAAVECVRVPISCASSADCVDGSICKESMCLPRCRNDQECALNEKCLQGSCMLTCRLDNDCFLGHICLTGRCVYGCHADSDCSASETCRDNRCVNPCSDNPCGPNAACTVVNHRASCSCFNGMVPSPTAKVGCVRAPALQCTENRDCADGTSCIDRLCRPVCGNDQGCLNNERCDGGSCKPICRKDDDCRTGEICQGQTCMIGCRSDSGCSDQLACIGQQCTDPCQEPTACGTNAECVVIAHRKQCSCPAGLVGDPFNLGCRQETHLCQTRTDCPKGQACYGGTCMQTCRNDQNCLADERCVRGTCRTVCNSDGACGNGLICEGRICQAGCRSDNQCANNQACINKKCTDPCATLGQCGSCSECTVIDHGVQCSCPHGYLGNPLLSCSPPAEKCHAQCVCDEDGMYCVKSCRQAKDCGCGQTCHRGKCRTKCNPGNCPAGLLCQNGACVAGCRTNADCPSDRSCTNGKCVDPCAGGKACGRNALCQVSDHRSLCLCPDGFQGDPAVGCAQYECQTNDDCELDKKCASGKCINPCLIPGACGLNAQCRVVNRQAQCSCTPGFFGNARQECQPVQKNSCAQNPCGDNTVCREDENGYECSCQPGCVGDPRQGCLCEGKLKKDDCEQYACGTNAVCRMTEWGAPSCVCLPTHPHGDPYMSCTQDDTGVDCRTTGCVEGECVRDGTKFICRKELGCKHSNECPLERSCINGICVDPCRSGNPCDVGEECEVQNHETVCVKLCQCEKAADCGSGQLCDGCNCVQKDTDRTTGCEHCPPGIPCDPITGGCVKEPPGSPKIPEPCQSDNDCLDNEACYMGLCENPCLFDGVCAETATCQAKMHRPICTCPPGHEGNPTIKCTVLEPIQCTTNDECSLTEACVGNVCHRPCDVKNLCTTNAVCINTNHGTDCSCIDGYHGNGFVQCIPVTTVGSVCQYNEDCPPDKLCDRLNRICINPCQSDSCGENADCYPVNHGIDCRCRAGYAGNAYIECTQPQGCLSDRQCNDNEACIKGRCSSPCQCGPNAMCDVKNHKSICRCPPGYGGNARIGCNPPSNPCDPNPCGINAMCEVDNGSPVCFCPRGLTGNPFKNCIPEGDECTPNPCGPNSGCRKINGKATCFCLPEFEGNPPHTPCTLPQNPCVPSPCGPNTQCTILGNGYAKCTCVPGYIESPNTIRGCVEPSSPCDPNPCGFGAICDATRNPVCYCPDSMIGNPYRSCLEPVMTPELCQPGPCGANADCYVAEGREQCYCKPNFIGDPYGGCVEQPRSVCEPNPCGPGAECVLLVDGAPGCRCPPGLSGDPTTTGCHAFECLSDDQCAADKACIGLRCSDPCPGSCGTGAHCRVEKHHPVCFCDAGLTGNPAIQCYSLDERPRDACNPSPCGANARCTLRNKRPVCKCLTNYHGDPRKGCKPECDINSDCTPDKSCINHKCVSPCALGTVCGVNAECSVNYHTPMCKCPSGYTGDAFVQCVPIPEERNMTRQPCLSDPCGPGEICSIYGNDVALCDPCVAPDAIHNPRCRPQCVLNTDCPFNMACLQSQCQDPCPGSCGYNALCTVERHRPVCYCPPNMHGNPYEQCKPQESPRETCDSIRCGANTQCKQQNGVLACVCKKNYYGDPLVGCRPECVVNTDCPISKACVNSRCVDPCVDACGVNAQCKVVNHLPICFCPPTHTGDALVACTERTYLPPDNTPCDPNPCGPNSKCRTTPDGYAICSCLPGYRGVPPACQAECMINAECPQNKACINLKCADPCPGTCGVGARCEVLNHNPICSCGANQQGDPFVICESRQNEPPIEQRNPCDPSPCGPNSLCQVRSRRPVCSCQPNFIGSPPACRPECVLSSECPQDKACINEKCQNPCANACGANADCHIVAHSAFCSCRAGFEGDAFIGCSAVPNDTPKDVCYPNPCAENAICSEHNGAAKCTCITPYLGDPYNTGCRPECVLNSDCPSHSACVNQHCRDPCPGVCGTNADCTVATHIPVCECSRGYVGDPFRGCRKDIPPPVAPKDPCASCPSNSVCRVVGGRPTCSCAEGYRGTPPACRPECSSNEECPHDRSCINLKCKDPCPGLCGINAQCQVINHKPFCSCQRDMIGNPFEQCYPKPAEPVHPCQPSPCGAYSECREIDNRAVCTCAAGMLGAPPNCRPECETDQDCPSNRACFNQKCRDPCVGSCGYNAECTARNHRPECNCVNGFEGDPYSGCNPVVVHEETPMPCNPSPCGTNAICKERNGAGSCTCAPEYFGDPYVGCRPECVMNSDCPRTRACINNKCQDPCPGTCGVNAECHVVNHSPSCVCLAGFVGNPFTECRPQPEIQDEPIVQPCQPSPCGPNSVCRVLNNHAVCTCQQNYIGSPPNCRPECVVSSECSLDKSCVKTKCTDPCPGTCGFNARCQVVNHNPICSCKAGFTGDPFVRCVPEERRPVVQERPAEPCIPSPCGPNSQCKAVGQTAACSCLPNYVGRAPNCRPECTSNSQCTPMKACINERCSDPCPGSCGSNALCTVQNHQPNCRCIEGYEGDPYTSCAPIIIHREPEIVDPCNPSPCGINADCNVRNNAGSCTCVQDYFGDPYHECRPECMLSSDCANTRACLNNKCVDPCPGMCGLNAECFVMNHSPSCSCLPGYTGNPSQACREIPKQIEHTPVDPCRPSPCGPYSQCRNVNDHAVCSCQANYIGTPPACRPECTVSSECALDKACIKQSCLDPCPGTCGFNARCTVINHNPICSCPSGFTGDPFERCVPEEKQVVQAEPTNPCLPSPCGPNSQCRAVGNVPACSCLPNYVGRAPNCRPECTINAECSGNLACVNEKCADPCPGSCGPNAACRVIEHSPTCSCQTGYTGDPFSGCTVIPLTPVREEPRNPCNPSPCGSNAVCKERNGAGSCTCLSDYFGDPYSGCRPECVTNSDCPRVRACVNNKCADPCPGVCGIDAECYVVNHSPSCACQPGYTGDPFTQCRLPEQPKQNEPINPCSPSPCGPNSICRESNGHAVCTCQPSFIGSPPNCRPECIVSSECSLDKACIGQKCNDPCPGTCGQNARCQVVNHNPICSCSLGFTGDPFVRCVPVEKAPVVQEPIDPCVPSPCGPNSVCRAIGSTPACSCLPNYIGRAPNCRPECMLNAECAATLACVNERCTNPCVGSCGINARCTVVKHNPICECEAGFTGDPFSVCTEIVTIRDEEPVNPCNPSPCGANAICKERNGAGSCTCMPEYFGDPYTGCRPECVQNTDCEKSKACMNNKCRDPCPGVCGLNAECVVQNHSPVCYCLEGYTGDPASTCTLAEIVTERPKLPGCQPSPCGPNSQCREINGHPVCSCLAGYIGTPPMCRPECVVSSECSQDRACVNKKCVDPCPGTCGTDARCQVVNHNPICSCPPGFTGDPFIQCAKKEEQKDITPLNPCVPSPCGPNANCRTVGSQPACSCAPNYIGRPPNCRPECTRDAECPSNLACQNERCLDPCAAGCGSNAVCRVINHKPVCTCDVGFEGNPLEQCSRILPPTTERLTPCTPSPCGPNAECRERNNAGACYCLAGYEGNPYDVFSGCRRECDINSDCSDKLACVQYKCVDPCPGVCGTQALCEIHNHVPTCICPDGMVGDPFVQCNLRMADPVTPAPPVCDKYTCGPNSICRIQNGVAICKCQPDMVGSPPNCRPECQQNSDCEANRACVNFRCIDPCPGSCGQNANCNIINHNPICSCTPGFTGDPFTRCYKEIIPVSTTEAPRALCTPSPCGPNAECKVVGDREACSCLPGYIGTPPSCRPECILSTECSDHLACIRQKCTDPCPGSCGLNAKCSVSRHTPSCSCDAGFTGDPFTGCQAIIVTTPPPLAEPRDPCYPSPCGINARCRPANGGKAICECIENYFGNPYETCRPECVSNGDCQKSLACINNRCKDPCPGVCGRNADCSVVNHTPVCSCPEGMRGNAFEQCLREQAPPPPSDPCYPSPCGQNTVCRVLNGNAVCECLPEFKGSPFGRGCYPECVINSDCPRDRTCVNKKCVDPCPGVCGYRAECHAINNSPVCSCPRNMIGDPFVECKVAPPKDPCNPTPCRTNGICRVIGDRAECQYPECIINSDCSTNRACYNQRCQDPCVGACGINALCSVINHAPVCSCPARHAGSPFVQCMPQRDEPIQPQPECTTDNQCTNDKACINEQCQNPCTIGTGLCTQNAECRVQFHRAICACREGYTGNAQLACYEIGCRSDSDCPATEACVNKNCIDPCRHTQCGRNAYCKSDYNHNARCHCTEGYRGNPLIGCTRPECTSNDECPYHQSCQNEQCRDPCNCAPNAQCRVDNHQANCRCPPGYTGDPLFSCEKIPVRDPPQCTMDADCSSKLACFEGVCKNPCAETKPCAEHAICTVQDTLPLRTMYCVCEEGYAGDAERQCLPVSKEEPGCYSDVECAPTESCRGRVCVDVCSNYNPCAPTAECLAQSHKAICSCPIGTVGDPFQNCYKPPVVSPECVVDADCASTMACVNERCQDPCAGSNPCGGNAECRAIYHRPHCTCPIGWGGDPKTQCYKPECKIDAECPFDKACFNEKCISPCTYGATQCGRGANCVAQSHRAVCICPPGTQGNPFVSCVTGMCQYNEDCAEHEACDRLNRVCRPVCEDETCARTATCVAKNHQASCECAPGMRGNPYVECMRDEPEPECRMDSECRSQQACIRNRCVNPCTELTPCTNQQICNVIDTLPLRTIICACQTDMLMDRSGSCKPIVIDECRLDTDCADTERCQRGQCITACKADPCGINAQCTSASHRAQCTCSPGYFGNAHIECLPEPRVTSPKECVADDDCSDDRSCFNDRCINPCVSDACGRGALCRANNHKAVCNCPAGYTMDGNGNCVPPAGDLPRCRSNSDCTQSETCVNEICANPCNCGQNADCFVKDHYPVCSCRPGYSGNAQTGCFKLECQGDNDCTNDKQCTNGACVDPCLYQNPCALNAECYFDRHRAACRCLPGLEGNPFERCRRVECHYDAECAQTLACQQEQCVDPCTNSPCAQNAQCFVINHQAQCKCPEQMPEGNPYSFCRPRAVEREECRVDGDCPSRLACIGNRCLNPCDELKPCAASALCTVQDSVPVRTMVCECPPMHVPDTSGECKRIVLQTPVGVCTTDSECPEQEACINRQCRDPCSCGTNAVCSIKNHRAVCSCEDGYEGNPNVACRAIGCRVDSECETSKACVNGNCVNPCLDHNPCGIGAECFGRANRAECRCVSGYRGNPMVQCNVVECRSNNDCPDDKQCRNSQCVNPCIYENSCSPRAECRAQNHLVVCRCPVGLVGNPYVDCRPEIVPECRYDTECPSYLACIDNKCTEPCSALTPCNQPARCEVVPSSPVRTMLCTCPDGYVSSGSGTCKPVVKAGCISDSDCSSDTACINSICRDPCNCGPNAECRVKDHKPVCSCAQGYDGDPETQCIKIECRSDSDCSGQHMCYNRQCVPACSMESCGTQAECIGVNHRAVCECVPGYEGNPKVACKLIGCRRDTDCPLDKACINSKCQDPCELQAVCAQNEQCQVYQHRPECACPPPFETDPLQGCVLRDDRCMTDGECPSQTACIQGECVNPCNVTEPCGVNSNCKVLDTLPVRTMICECLPGYQGNAAIQCDKMALCPTDRGFVRNSNGECVCPPGYGLSLYDDCQPCREEDGLKVDETGRCVCALERGLIIDERGRCICPIEYGYRLTSRGECVRSEKPECERDEHCADWRYCNLESKTCDDPCQRKVCGTNALCNATNHQAVCQCITGYTGNPEEHCNQTTNFRTDFPQPEMEVTCQADGVQVVIDLAESNFNGVLYVKGHSKDEECRRVVNLAGDSSSVRTQIFKVHFGSCGLIHVNGIASFVLVIQKHPKLVTYKAQAYHIKCVYQTGEQNVTLGFNVQMLTTAGTIANTGPPPTCAMRIVAFNGEEINSAEIGDNLRLQVEVQPATIYGGFARSCVAKTMEESVENEYIVTDEDGCATDPSIFGDWEYNAETNSLLASFNAFKFPSSDNIRFQCNIRVCFGKCQPVNCHGANAYGKRRRRREALGIDMMRTIEVVYNRTRRAADDTALATDDSLGIEGTLREEITIQSNAILTLEKREERSFDSNNITPAAQRVEDICVSMIGLILALVITALLALVAVAVAVSCWLMAYRRRPTITGPLPHPPEFPNPLFAHHEPSEPSHHDFMG